MVARNWLPKDWLTADSRILGIDTVAHNLARTAVNAEIDQLLAALPDTGPCDGASESELSAVVEREIERLREAGRPPTLVLLPVSWRLRQALGFPMWGGTNDLVGNPLVPIAKADKFAGIFAGVPVLDAPQVQKDLLWIVSVPTAAAFVEWPSDDESGVRLELQSFSADEARVFLEEQPKVAGDAGLEEAVLSLQEQVLFSQHLCWMIQPQDPEGATSIQIPPPLVFEG